MTKQSFLDYCLNTFGTSPDYPFDEDFETAVLRHADNRKWFALLMKVSRRKFGFDSDEPVDVVNLKLPVEMFGSFGKADGVYPGVSYEQTALDLGSASRRDGRNHRISYGCQLRGDQSQTVQEQRKKHMNRSKGQGVKTCPFSVGTIPEKSDVSFRK